MHSGSSSRSLWKQWVSQVIECLLPGTSYKSVCWAAQRAICSKVLHLRTCRRFTGASAAGNHPLLATGNHQKLRHPGLTSGIGWNCVLQAPNAGESPDPTGAEHWWLHEEWGWRMADEESVRPGIGSIHNKAATKLGPPSQTVQGIALPGHVTGAWNLCIPHAKCPLGTYEVGITGISMKGEMEVEKDK